MVPLPNRDQQVTIMKKLQRLAQAKIESIVSPLGGTVEVSQRRRTGHYDILISIGSWRRRLTMAGTPSSDEGCVMNFVRQSVNRALREAGYV